MINRTVEHSGPGNSSSNRQATGFYSLRQLVREQPIDVDSVLPKFIKILSVVEKAHEQGKQHQQLRPDNIRLNEKGDARIPLLVSASVEKTAYSSPKHAAPEDFETDPGISVCQSRDAYVLGFMFYEILLGRSSFRTEFAEVYERGDVGWLHWHADKNKSAKPLAQLIKGFPCGLSDLIRQMLIKDPQLRTADLQAIKRWFAFSRQLTKYEGQALRAKGEGPAAEKQATRTQKFLAFAKKWFGVRVLSKTWNFNAF